MTPQQIIEAVIRDQYGREPFDVRYLTGWATAIHRATPSEPERTPFLDLRSPK
jgi:hypothetical protein